MISKNRPTLARDLENERPSLEAIIFDMGDVLFDATAWRRWLARLLGRLGISASYRELFARWDSDFLIHVHCGRATYRDAFASFLASWGLSNSQIVEASAASMAQKKLIEQAVMPFPGVVRTLGRLNAAGFRMGVLSDSESTGEQLAARLSQLGLGKAFRAVVTSFDLGKCKPDPACYAATLEALGASAAESLFVGHDADELDGAAAVGLRTAAINYSPGVAAGNYLKRFDDLWELAVAERALGRGPRSEAA